MSNSLWGGRGSRARGGQWELNQGDKCDHVQESGWSEHLEQLPLSCLCPLCPLPTTCVSRGPSWVSLEPPHPAPCSMNTVCVCIFVSLEHLANLLVLEQPLVEWRKQAITHIAWGSKCGLLVLEFQTKVSLFPSRSQELGKHPSPQHFITKKLKPIRTLFS